jgi:PAS domain S-box-containing protein
MVAAGGTPQDILDRIARSGDAAMAIDYSGRIILWTREAERVFDLPSRRALGKHCYEVTGGRDIHGNRFCHQTCALAHQARTPGEKPVRSYPLEVKTGHGKTKWVNVTLFAIPDSRPSLATIVHIFRDTERKPSPLMKQLAKDAPPPSPADAPMARAETASRPLMSRLTAREKEILRCYSEGLATLDIAKRLHISGVTVRNHTQNILQKLDVHSKLAAVAFVFQHDLV